MKPELLQVAAQLGGREYRDELREGEEAMLKASGLVVVFGAGDDLIEFRGAIHDEVGAYGGGAAHLTSDGLLQNDCEDDDCPYFDRIKAKAATITAKFDNRGFTFTYETDIPHAKFIIVEDGDNYCEGIVFALADVKEPSA